MLEAKVERLVDVRSDTLHLRLAETMEEVAAAQSLRYQVFYREMSAKPTAEMAAAQRDFDAFDAYCDHMIGFDSARRDGPRGPEAARAGAARAGGRAGAGRGGASARPRRARASRGS